MKRLLKRLLPSGFKKALKRFMGIKSMESRLLNLRHAGFSCQGAVDVGACRGDWTRALREVWEVPVLMVEPQPGCKALLESHIKRSARDALQLETCALGKTTGSVEFLLEETNSRIAGPGERSESPVVTVPVRTLRGLLDAHPIGYNLLKLDVQGRELDVLDGADGVLEQFEVIVMEVSIIRIGPVPTFHEVMRYMDCRGYRLYDFLPMYYRPLDNALWQGDAFFVRNDSPLVSSLSWS